MVHKDFFPVLSPAPPIKTSSWITGNERDTEFELLDEATKNV